VWLTLLILFQDKSDNPILVCVERDGMADTLSLERGSSVARILERIAWRIQRDLLLLPDEGDLFGELRNLGLLQQRKFIIVLSS